MKKINFLKRGAGSVILVIIFAVLGTEIFQGQKVPMQVNENTFNYDENDPYIDRPTREALSHVTGKTDDDLDIITDGNGFDNFEIGVDFAEQMLVSNPLNPLQMQFGVNSATTGQNAYYTSNGHDWTQSNPAYHPSICCDPWSAWDGLGRLVYGSGVANQYVYRSANGGQTYGAAILSVSGNDRNTLAAEQTGTGPFANYLYAAITPGNFSRSLNNGVTWATTYSPSNTIPGTMIAVGPNGATNGGCVIYVTNTGTTSNVTYTFHRSIDGGATFGVRSNLTTAGHVGTLNTAGRLVINNGRTRPYPMIAMDNSNGPNRGRLYLVYASNVPSGNGNKPDIRLRYSDDQALTWSAAVTVNDNTNPQLSDQWFPAIWCEVTTGRLYIKWYDTRENPATYATNVYATYTDDGGATFAPNQKLTTTSWTYPNPACAPNTNCYRGDYDGMTANPKAGFAVWYDGRSGTYKNVGSYFPDYGMLVTPAAETIHQTNGSKNLLVNIPAVKLYTDVTSFSASVTPAPATGSFSFEFLGGNTLSTYPNTKNLKVRTVGTVTPTGNYTITVTGQGSNGTPVHKRTVTMTVNSTLSAVPCQDFTLTKFPPADFFEEYSGTNYWSRYGGSAYGIGSGSARFNFYSAPVGTVQSIVTNNFAAVGANTFLTFDEAYAPFTANGPDTLQIEVSSNLGVSYTTLATLLGKADGTGELNTAPPSVVFFFPSSSQWRPKIYLLPVGTNKVRLKARSGDGNNLFIDNLCVQTLASTVTNTVGVIPEGLFLCSSPFIVFNDTVKVYLHRVDFPEIAVDSAIAPITNGGIATPLLFNKALNGTYYKRVNHRNSIETWTKAGGEPFTRGVTTNYNLITPSGRAYNNNQHPMCPPNDWWGMFSGDVDQDYQIDVTDLVIIYNDQVNFTSGYVVTDLNGDFFVDVSDLIICYNNAIGFVQRQAPPGAEPVPQKVITNYEKSFESEADRKKYEAGLAMLNAAKEKEKQIAPLTEVKNETYLMMEKIINENSIKTKKRSAENKVNLENTNGPVPGQ